MKRHLIPFILIAATSLAACGMAKSSSPVDSLSVEPGYALPAATFAPSVAQEESLGFASGAPAADAAAESPVAANRLVITNVSLQIVVDDTTATADRITQLAEGMGGFVVSLNMYESYYGTQGQLGRAVEMTIRVPSGRLNEALSQLKGMAVEVKGESRSSQDVTADYVDLQSRLANLEAAEQQLQSIMDEATKTEDVLSVYNQLVYVREQIEVIKGQMKYYEESAALSSISISLMPNIVSQPIQIGGWHPEGTAKEAIEDLVRTLQDIADFLIYFSITCLPVLVVLGVPGFFIARAVWRRLRRKTTPPAA